MTDTDTGTVADLCLANALQATQAAAVHLPDGELDEAGNLIVDALEALEAAIAARGRG